MADYIYTRKDGGTTHCYGKLTEGYNLAVTCDNEWYDGIVADVELTTWLKVCKYLEENYNSRIEELETV